MKKKEDVLILFPVFILVISLIISIFTLNSCTTIAEDENYENITPICEISLPLNYSTFIPGDLISFEATANDSDGSISSVKFYLDSVLIAEDSSSPYEYSIIADTLNLSLGLHNITAISIDNDGDFSLEASTYFLLNSSALAEAYIIINEISYNPPFDYYSGDWVEFYNNGTEEVNLSGWIFRDSDSSHTFTFPDSSIIMPDSFLVIINDFEKFVNAFPDVANSNLVVSEVEFDFNLSEDGELVSLSNNENNIIDILEYDDVYPWPLDPDGLGSSLELKNPNYSNPFGSNWGGSVDCYGTPGARNSAFEE